MTARGLVKRFGSLVAVDGVSFDIGRGESFGFLGPNGAGKTSTMRMISCMSPASRRGRCASSAGPVRQTAPAIRARIGLVPQEDTLDLELTVRDNLLVYGRDFDLPRRVIRGAGRAPARVRPADRARRRKVDTLSGGLKRRLTIARVARVRAPSC